MDLISYGDKGSYKMFHRRTGGWKYRVRWDPHKISAQCRCRDCLSVIKMKNTAHPSQELISFAPDEEIFVVPTWQRHQHYYKYKTPSY